MLFFLLSSAFKHYKIILCVFTMDKPPIWKRTPLPCEAHKILVNMFETNKIARDATPAEIYRLSPKCQEFKIEVFRNHFNQLRNKYGLECKDFLSLCYNRNFTCLI